MKAHPAVEAARSAFWRSGKDADDALIDAMLVFLRHPSVRAKLGTAYTDGITPDIVEINAARLDALIKEISE
jgi:hypothetical protein